LTKKDGGVIKKENSRGKRLAGNSILKFCFIVSLCVHFCLGFFPFFTNPKAQKPPEKFVEVLFSKTERDNRSLEVKRDLAKANLDSLRVSSLASTVSDISVGSNSLSGRIGQMQQDNYNEESSEIIEVSKRLEIDLGDFEDEFSRSIFSNYAHILRNRILERIIYPQAAFRKNMEGTVQLKFILLPDGNLRDIYVLRSSNCLVLDVAAIDAVEKATPFPPFPKNLRAKELFVKVPIVYKLN